VVNKTNVRNDKDPGFPFCNAPVFLSTKGFVQARSASAKRRLDRLSTSGACRYAWALVLPIRENARKVLWIGLPPERVELRRRSIPWGMCVFRTAELRCSFLLAMSVSGVKLTLLSGLRRKVNSLETV
jgi:hypothetical protein